MSLLDDDKQLEVPQGQSSYQVYKNYYDKHKIEYDADDLPLDIETAYLPEDMSTPDDAAGCLRYFELNAMGGKYSERGNTLEEINEFWRRILEAAMKFNIKLTPAARTKAKELKLIKDRHEATYRKKE